MTEQPNPQQGQPNPPQPNPPQQTPPYKRLTRTSWDAPISGVCGGLARYFGVDPTLIRVLAVIGAVVTFPAGVIAYAVAWAVMPKE
jgi:phage shock protein PspC (stress-responsive transcriptional regulator)